MQSIRQAARTRRVKKRTVMSTTESMLTLTTIETESRASTTTLSAAHRSGAQSSMTRACFGDSTRCVWLEHLQLELEMGCPGPGADPEARLLTACPLATTSSYDTTHTKRCNVLCRVDNLEENETQGQWAEVTCLVAGQWRRQG